MNFLAHLFLCPDQPEILVGSLMGDFVKGRLDDRYPPRVSFGITVHRRIDSHAATHRLFLRSKRRIDPAFGHFRGILVDLFYDHFLADDWSRWSDVPFDAFVADTHRIMRQHTQVMPEQLRRLVPVIFTELLPSYREVGGIERALRRMSQRVGRNNPLANGAGELIRQYEGLREDSRGFFRDALEYVKELEREEAAAGQPVREGVVGEMSGGLLLPGGNPRGR